MVDLDEIKLVAKMSKFKFSEEELFKFKKQLGEIIKIIKKLNSIDTEGVEPLYSPLGSDTPLREDIIENCDIKKDILESSEYYDSEKISIPRVV